MELLPKFWHQKKAHIFLITIMELFSQITLHLDVINKKWVITIKCGFNKKRSNTLLWDSDIHIFAVSMETTYWNDFTQKCKVINTKSEHLQSRAIGLTSHANFLTFNDNQHDLQVLQDEMILDHSLPDVSSIFCTITILSPIVNFFVISISFSS